MNQRTLDPVRVSVEVNGPPELVFRVFTEEIGHWWPLDTHSISADAFGGKIKAETVVFERRVGGRIYQRMGDGKEADWGRVLSWDPPHRVIFSWKPNMRSEPYTEVEVRFIEDGFRTRVELEHRAWERLGERGPERRESYPAGWQHILNRFATFKRGPADSI